jgi:hypothetical protein
VSLDRVGGGSATCAPSWRRPSAATTWGGSSQAREEIEALTQRLAAAMGLGGRDRPAGSAAERARSTVTQRLSSCQYSETIPSTAERMDSTP